MSKSPRHSPAKSEPTPQPELVDPAFLLKGFGVAFAAALILAYVTLCIFYARSQWQLVLHPSAILTASPSSFGLDAAEVHFGVDSSGEPQIDGWWIPASGATRTVLMLHSATGNMADALGSAQMLHQLGLNALLFDYRGYGKSGSVHPDESSLQADARSAFDYLVQARGINPSSLVVYGRDLGAPVALHLCSLESVQCQALILDAPDGDLLERITHDARSRAVPSSLLFHERFPLAAPLAASTAPKLLLRYDNNPPSRMLHDTHNPKMLLAIRPGDNASLRAGIQRFLDSY